MTIRELLVQVVGALETERIPYMLTGSLASSLYGEPRATNDIDLVIDPSPVALDLLVARLQRSGLYVDLEAARAALGERGQFNALMLDTKVDLIIRKAGPFATSAFERRRRVRGSDIDADVVSPEDLLLTKLAWAVETGSDRQLRDVEGMFAITENLDLDYIATWASRLGVGDAWRRLTGGDAQG